MDNNKGRTVELSTFLSYKKSNVIGYKTIVIREKTLVNFIWCKLCATFKDQLLSSASLKGSARTAALAFINGTMEYPNISLLAKLMLCLSGSNSSVERAFTVLTMMLSDKRLRTSHKLMNMRLVVSINDRNWDIKEREEIIEKALEIYLSKKSRKRKLDEENNTCPSDTESELSEEDELYFTD